MGRYTMKFKEYLEKLESLDVSKTLLKEDKIVLFSFKNDIEKYEKMELELIKAEINFE